MNKLRQCQLAAIGWLILLMASMPYVMIGCILLFYFNRNTQKPNHNAKILPKYRKTVLITGAPLSKALHMVRVMGQAGHKVIVADRDPSFGLNMARFSKFTDKFVQIWAKSSLEYMDKLVKIARENRVDWYMPVSHTHMAEIDIEARSEMDKLGIKSMALDHSGMARDLDDKLQFLKECQDLGLRVPDFRRCSSKFLERDLRKYFNEGLFKDRYFFLKPAKLQRDQRMDLTRIPGAKWSFEEYMVKNVAKKPRNVSYVLNEFIDGPEFASNVICKDGKVLMLQVCPCSSIQVKFEVVHNPDIKQWIQKYVNKKNLTGLLSFDFIQDRGTGEMYCIEGNPRLHSCIVSFSSQKQMSSLEQVIRQGLEEPDNLEDDKPLTIQGSKPVYWFFNEVGTLLTGQGSLDQFLDSIQNGQEAIWRLDDPWPFLVLNFVQMPILLLKSLIFRRTFNKVNFCLGQPL